MLQEQMREAHESSTPNESLPPESAQNKTVNRLLDPSLPTLLVPSEIAYWTDSFFSSALEDLVCQSIVP